jgi:outer membrane protein assembly factor BamB
VSLSNEGTGICQLTDIALGSGTDPAFSLVGSPGNIALAPGSTGSLTVTVFVPAQEPVGVKTGTLAFDTNDPGQPIVTVPLSAFSENQACHGGCGGQWPQWHADNDDTGYGNADTSGNTGEVLWTFPLGAADAGETYSASPVLDDQENVYFTDGQGVLHVIGPTGSQVFSTQTQATPLTPAIEEDGASLFEVTPLDAGPLDVFIVPPYVTGQQVTSASESCAFLSNPNLGNDGTLYLAGLAPSGVIEAAAVDTSLAFTTGPLPLPPSSTHVGVAVAYSNRASYWAAGGVVAALTAPFLGPGQSLVTLPGWPDGGVTVASSASDPSAIEPVISDLALDEATTGYLLVYSAWQDAVGFGGLEDVGNLVALDPSSGATVWTFTLPGDNAYAEGLQPLAAGYGHASPAISPQGVVYVGSGDGLHAIDGATGQQLWWYSSNNVTAAPAVSADGTVFFGTADGHFYALTAAGALRFQVTTGARISSSPAIGEDGTVFFACDDGNLYSVH